MFTYRRFVLFTAALSTTLALYGCQPTIENDETLPTEEATASSIQMPDFDTNLDTVENIDPHASHEMAEGNMMGDEAQMTDILKEYTKSMTQMHDEMMIGMVYNDPDTAFAKGMLGHHRGAVDMAKIELKYGTNVSMRALAQAVIKTQQTEIDTLKKWLASHPDSANPKPTTLAMQSEYATSMDAMHGEMMLGIADPAPDMAFARGMLPHHIGAVDMAKIQLKYGEDKEMRALAQEIVNTQQSEIQLMQNWIATYGADNVLPPSSVSSDNDALSKVPESATTKPTS